ncbi:hypothetical protein SAMN06269117_12131 [Balnearium lithotrophicum]|uniref:Uncharacterized protein n=1 Tax=Balnearium lithotrophicum TaxID=223788 RepID=A0A521DKS0_9BACT|nr:hypothetical protein [Balnearium lithotrophicum]SMO71520.1 hypothetical protein SAMN06269117_12131 [Balnearium lithotrophicum]
MEEISSRWILQEVFVDPNFSSKTEEFSLNLKISSEFLKEEENPKVVVEISGSITGESGQIANVRFVNLTGLSKKTKVRRKTILKKVEKERVSELLSFLPLYLLKSGIVVREVKREL